MSNLQLITNNQETITSMEVAQMVGKQHKELLRDIRRYSNQINKANENSLGVEIALSAFFKESTYKDSSGKENPCFNVTKKGCEFIGNKLTGQKGTEFTARYVNRFHELQEENFENSLVKALNSISESMINMKTEIDERLTSLEKSQAKPKLPANKYSRWKTNTFNKFKLLQSYVNENSDQNLTLPRTMKLVFDELQDTYNIEISDYDEMYKCEYGLDLDTKVQTLDVINHYKDIRDMFTLTLDSVLERLHLQDNEEIKSHTNIFDELAAQIENQTENN